MRIGFAVGNPHLIKYLNDVKYSFNSYTMSQAALELGAAAVKVCQKVRVDVSPLYYLSLYHVIICIIAPGNAKCKRFLTFFP